MSRDSDKPRVEALDRFGSKLAAAIQQTSSSNDSAPRGRLGLAAGVATILFALFVSLTPPGRALAEEFGHLVGIGDPPTQGSPFGEKAIVIGSGESARTVPYEIVAATNASGKETCVSVEFPSVRTEVGAGNCLTGHRSIPLEDYARRPSVFAAPSDLHPEGELIVAATLPLGAEPRVSYVDSSGESDAATARYADLTPTLSRPIDVNDEFRYFFAVIPSGVLRGSQDDPKLLTQDALYESLARIQYSVTAQDGTVIVADDLATLLGGPLGSEPLYTSLLYEPPKGFRLDPPPSNLPDPVQPPPPGGPGPFTVD